MIINISGVNIKLETENIFNKTASPFMGQEYEIVIKQLNSLYIPIDCKFKYKIDEINIFHKDNVYYFVSCNVLVVKVDSNSLTWKVMVNRNISTLALQEIIVKKIIPLFCYKTYCALPLHATAVIKSNKLLCFSGHSKSGKSTLAASFIYDDEYKLISDDILNLFCKNNKIYTFPSYSQLKLRTDSLKEFGCENKQIKQIASCSLKLADIILLSNHHSDDIRFEKIIGNKSETLLQNLFAANLCDFKEQFLSLLFEICNNLTFWKLYYPKTYSRLEDVRKAIISKFEENNYE